MPISLIFTDEKLVGLSEFQTGQASRLIVLSLSEADVIVLVEGLVWNFKRSVCKSLNITIRDCL